MTATLEIDCFDALQAGDLIVAMAGRPLPAPRQIVALEASAAVLHRPGPNPHGVEWRVYAANVSDGLTVERATVEALADVEPLPVPGVDRRPTMGPAVPAPVEAEPPPGYYLVPPRPLAPATANAHGGGLPYQWVDALDGIGRDGAWRPWGDGHTTSPFTGALHRRGLIDVARPITGRARYLYRVTKKGRQA